jgi:hypothetical protein
MIDRGKATLVYTVDGRLLLIVSAAGGGCFVYDVSTELKCSVGSVKEEDSKMIFLNHRDEVISEVPVEKILREEPAHS